MCDFFPGVKSYTILILLAKLVVRIQKQLKKNTVAIVFTLCTSTYLNFGGFCDTYEKFWDTQVFSFFKIIVLYCNMNCKGSSRLYCNVVNEWTFQGNVRCAILEIRQKNRLFRHISLKYIDIDVSGKLQRLTLFVCLFSLKAVSIS